MSLWESGKGVFVYQLIEANKVVNWMFWNEVALVMR